jgi:hypothetical protein
MSALQQLDPASAVRQLERLIAAQNHAEALTLCDALLATAPDNPVYWNARGLSLRNLDRPREALPCFWRSIALDPQAPASWTNLGNALKDLKQLRRSILAHRRAVALRPRDAMLSHNLGLALVQDRQFDAGIAAFDRTLALDPRRRAVCWDRALARLYRGDYAGGWQDYEARLTTGQMPPRPVPGVAWDGSPFPGQTLLVLSEQGFGDAIWVARFLSRLRALGGRAILEARPELVSLLEGQGCADAVLPKGAPLPAAAPHVHQCSLPRLFAATPQAVQGQPYLSADPARIARFSTLFADTGSLFKLGIVWSGSPTFKGNADRAQPLTRFLDTFALPGVQLYSLQKGPQGRELDAVGKSVIDLGPHLRDFADTAAMLHHLDLVIMTDTAVAHLCGALGRPVWVLLNHVPHFIWSEACDAAPWYDSVRLFRPKAWNDWNGVYDQAGAALLQVVLGRAART